MRHVTENQKFNSGDLPITPHKRRPRYPGRNPRRFADKYKEHNPARYAEDVQKVIAGGKTPAGSHRPICVREIMEILAPRPREIAVDATLGYGGHALELLRKLLPGGRLIGLDVDPIELPRTDARLRELGIPNEALAVHRSNFAGLPQILATESLESVDIILADLGMSSMQIDNPERGFSYKQAGPLDLRMNSERGRPGSAFLAAVTEPTLAQILEENADEPRAAAIAQFLCQSVAQRPINTTTDLARRIRESLKSSRVSTDQVELTIRRVFQALRIAVNDEFGALDTFLRNLPSCLKSGGRVAILTFHSGEDRRVKKSFQAGERDGIYSRISHEVIRPSAEEIRSNPRASSAKLRWVIRD